MAESACCSNGPHGPTKTLFAALLAVYDFRYAHQTAGRGAGTADPGLDGNDSR